LWLLIIDDVEGIFGDETTPVIDVPNHTPLRLMERPSDKANPTSTSISLDDPEQSVAEVGPTIPLGHWGNFTTTA